MLEASKEANCFKGKAKVSKEEGVHMCMDGVKIITSGLTKLYFQGGI